MTNPRRQDEQLASLEAGFFFFFSSLPSSGFEHGPIRFSGCSARHYTTAAHASVYVNMFIYTCTHTHALIIRLFSYVFSYICLYIYLFPCLFKVKVRGYQRAPPGRDFCAVRFDQGIVLSRSDLCARGALHRYLSSLADPLNQS